jgi:hypothetical protein
VIPGILQEISHALRFASGVRNDRLHSGFGGQQGGASRRPVAPPFSQSDAVISTKSFERSEKLEGEISCSHCVICLFQHDLLMQLKACSEAKSLREKFPALIE